VATDRGNCQQMEELSPFTSLRADESRPAFAIPRSLANFREYLAADLTGQTLTVTEPGRAVAAVIQAADLPAECVYSCRLICSRPQASCRDCCVMSTAALDAADRARASGCGAICKGGARPVLFSAGRVALPESLAA
jgi:hypothetical protein